MDLVGFFKKPPEKGGSAVLRSRQVQGLCKRGFKWPKVAAGAGAKTSALQSLQSDSVAHGLWTGRSTLPGLDVLSVENIPPEKQNFKIPKIKPPAIPVPFAFPRPSKSPVHFTLFSTNYTTASHVDAAALEAQIDATNKAFAPLGISFYMASFSCPRRHRVEPLHQEPKRGA